MIRCIHTVTSVIKSRLSPILNHRRFSIACIYLQHSKWRLETIPGLFVFLACVLNSFSLVFSSFNFFSIDRLPYHNEHHEIDPIPEGVSILDKIHHVRPSLKADHLQEREREKENENFRSSRIHKHERFGIWNYCVHRV